MNETDFLSEVDPDIKTALELYEKFFLDLQRKNLIVPEDAFFFREQIIKHAQLEERMAINSTNNKNSDPKNVLLTLDRDMLIQLVKISKKITEANNNDQETEIFKLDFSHDPSKEKLILEWLLRLLAKELSNDYEAHNQHLERSLKSKVKSVFSEDDAHSVIPTYKDADYIELFKFLTSSLIAIREAVEWLIVEKPYLYHQLIKATEFFWEQQELKNLDDFLSSNSVSNMATTQTNRRLRVVPSTP